MIIMKVKTNIILLAVKPAAYRGLYIALCAMLHPDVFEQSQELLVDELSRCSLLGLKLYNFLPGSSLGSITTEQCVEKNSSSH
ncbi:putative endonuclease 4 [Dissostichus eleginoides]|uniref:Endonuclease 4 n=1 Tax=Dissostichus eleginoides TaxID=100907 RepID=A0AAD9BEU0_DISEL|nr:putative endonuclease 4 [Dissostichus eleginoides]